ncbi:HI1506-related protein [Methylomagnum ishizawai]|uniref:HI1506-related protein n=1 Tax=Methylomagnum ishizawai TaxID=1760988 RepID=UPI000A169806|nr:HI1506-related protein [Methylomagnum ishizawai]
MPIRITSKRDGFRRCGVAHPATPTEYPADRFTNEQIARLRAEPMLFVEIIPDEAGTPAKHKEVTK